MLELNPKERDLMRRVIRGASNRDIAEALGCCLRVVENRRAAAFRKLGVTSTVAAGYAFAKIEPGLIELDPPPPPPEPKYTPDQRTKAADKLARAEKQLKEAQLRYKAARRRYEAVCGDG